MRYVAGWDTAPSKDLKRELTDVELACFENLWSSHCGYRSTRHPLRTLPTEGPGVLLGPGDDAAIVQFSDTCALAIGMESHNHPSYVDPYDGAATGVGGIVRDVLSMGARPIALMDPLYFGPLDSEKNRYIFEHVVAGVGGYGNCIGVPVVRGELVFESSYSGNPLVNVVCVGIVDPDRYITARVKKPGSRLVLIGSSTGRDGLGGASFASRDLAEDAEAADRRAFRSVTPTPRNSSSMQSSLWPRPGRSSPATWGGGTCRGFERDGKHIRCGHPR